MQGNTALPGGTWEELLAWIKHNSRTMSGYTGGRAKLILTAVVFVSLGYLMTASFSPSEAEFDNVASLDRLTTTSAGVLDGPAIYPDSLGPLYEGTERTSDSAGAVYVEDSSRANGKNKLDPSISGALSELHHAVTGKIASWKSWKRPDQTKNNPSNVNGSASDSYGAASTKETSVYDLDPFGHKTRVGKCTLIMWGSSIYERAVRTHEAHDRLHGYQMNVLRQQIMDDVWSKPAYILSLLLRELARPDAERLHWLLWVDADTIMLNPHIPIEVFLPPSPEFDDINLLVTHDWNGLNNGVFPIRVCQWSVDLFSAIVAYRHYRPDADMTFRDQSAMDALLHEKKFAANTVEAPQRWFNAYQGENNETLAPFQVRRGDFLVHFAGVLNRDERIMYWLDRAEQHLPDWEIEVKHTSYPSEVKDFWAQKSGERKANAAAVADTQKEAVELSIQTDSDLGDYADRLQVDEVADIRNKQSAMMMIMEGEVTSFEVHLVQEAMTALTKALEPLHVVIDQAKKALVKEAHNAVFAAEKDLLDHTGVTNPEVSDIELKTTALKELVLQANWQKEEMNNAIEALKQAREKLQEKMKEVLGQNEKKEKKENKV